MVSKIIPIEPFDCIVFGGSGDLAERKLIPALYHRQRVGQFTDPVRIIATSRKKLSDEDYRAFAKKAIETYVRREDIDRDELNRFLKRLHFANVDVTSDKGWQNLKKLINQNPQKIRAFYLAVSPDLFATIAQKLQSYALVNDDTRIIVEKPIGHDYASARQLNDTLGKVFKENQIFRIDHYLGKETVQNLMALRFANVLYEPIWNSNHIEHVEITVAETVGLEGRGSYYDHAGALRDMVQNHLLQLLCLVAMEPPAANVADAVRDEKLKVLKSLAPLAGADVAKNIVRGQYISGAGPDGAANSYLEDLDAQESNTETFVAMRVDIENWRWGGTPFYLRTGKRLQGRLSEIVVTFKPIPHNIFGDEAGPIFPNKLVIRLQPDEGVMQWLMIKDPGPGGMRLRQIPLDMTFADAFNERNPDAYERLLMDVIRGNQTLFMRRDEVEVAWRWIDPIIKEWEKSNEAPLPYTAGSWGPARAIALIERDGYTWFDTI